MNSSRTCTIASILLVVMGSLTGCQNSLLDRSLVFSTATTLGVEVSTNPSNTSGPVTLIAGYKRFEGVLNPVYYNHRSAGSADGNIANPKLNPQAINDVDDYYRQSAYPVIAKFEGKAIASASGAKAEVSGLSQWFATGEAANILARSGGAAALTDSPKVAEAVSRSGAILKELDAEEKVIDQRRKLIAWLATEEDGFDFLRVKIRNWWVDASEKDILIDVISDLADQRGIDKASITKADGTANPDGFPALIDDLSFGKSNHRLFLEEFAQNIEEIDPVD